MSNAKESAIDSMIKICFIGICIATCALCLVVSIMKGFEESTHQSFKTLYPDLILDANHHEIDMDKLTPILKEESLHISHASEQLTAQALLHHDEHDFAPTVICLKGIIPEKEMYVTNLHTKITDKNSYDSFQSLLGDNHIIIGYKLAKTFNLKPGDKVQLLYTNDQPEQLKVTFNQTSAIVSGIFKTGIDDFDSNFVYCHATFFHDLFPDGGVSQVYLKLQNLSYQNDTIKQLTKRLNVDVYSWTSLYPALISALKLETYAMSFILLLIIIIASMNSISLLFMYVTQKRKEIALFLCLGISIKKIRMIFMSILLGISIVATILGLLLALLIGLILQHFPIIKLPDDAYFSSYLPIQLDTLVFSAIFISSICISYMASLIATKDIKKIQIVKSLKE